MAQNCGQVVNDSIYSNILGTYCNYTVYLPKSFAINVERKYPILYLLHGMIETNYTWYDYRHFDDVMNLLVSSGEACELVVVTPCAGGRFEDGAWNGYFNMPNWAYEDFFFQEFLPYVETSYRAIGDRAHRGIAGLSMGGGGATNYAQCHTNMFAPVYAMSASMDIPVGRDHPTDNPNDMLSILTRSVMDHSCIKYILEANETQEEELRTVKWFVDCGDDNYLLDRNLEFFNAMRVAEIPCEFRMRNGGHIPEYCHTALYICLPYMSLCIGN